MILAGAITFLFPVMNPLFVGLAVAVAASIAKTAHYYVASYLGSKAGSKAEKLRSYGGYLGRWGALAAFVAAASPIPDDPIVIPLGMAQYSPVKFFIAYLTGKALVSVGGAYLGRQSALSLQTILPSNEYIIVTAVASILIASILVKADLPTWMSKLKKLVKRGWR
jgi:membrane protein DedA with SNARE-associated domain